MKSLYFEYILQEHMCTKTKIWDMFKSNTLVAISNQLTLNAGFTNKTAN